MDTDFWLSLKTNFSNFITVAGIRLIYAAGTIIIGLFIIRIIKAFVRRVGSRSNADPSLFSFAYSLVKFASYSLLIFVVGIVLGIQASAFLTLLGAIGLAVGLSLQGSLSNFAGGVLILVLKPFKIGDTIDSLGHIGEVVRISVLQTKLMTPDHKLVILPNGKVANTELVNYTSPTKRRSEFTIKIGYDEDIQKVRQIILAELNKVENIYKDPLPTVAVNKLGEVNVEILTRFWTDNGHQLGAMNDSLEAIKTTFQSQNVKITQGIQKIELIKDSN